MKDFEKIYSEYFDTVYQSLKNPPQYLALGRYEDLLDIERVDIVRIHPENEVDLKRDMYIPVENEWEKDEEKIKIKESIMETALDLFHDKGQKSKNDYL